MCTLASSSRPQRDGQRRPQLISLLEATANERRDLPLNGFDDRIVAWAIQSGLGPLFYRTAKQAPGNTACRYWNPLKAADLTAQVVIGDQLEAMAEIIDACRGQLPSLTLLKGISIADECYPETHLRLMRDLDFMIERQFFPTVKGLLERLGYRQQCDTPAEQYETHHHAAPFYHREKRVWVEVHHALLSPQRRASKAMVFQPENVFAQLRASDFRGRQVRRLSSELQLVYLATHWAQDFNRIGSLIAVMDTLYLLKHAGNEFRWDWVVNSVHGSIVATYLYLLLSYMDLYQLIRVAPEILSELFLSQTSFGRASLKAAHAIIDRYFVTGQEFGLLSERTVRIVWNTLMLPGPPWRNLMLTPINLSLPYYCRIR
jgi:hypothetical protein